MYASGSVDANIGVQLSRSLGVARMPVLINRVGVPLIAVFLTALFVVFFPNIVNGQVLEEQPISSTVDESVCNSSDCGTFIGSKSHTVFGTTTQDWVFPATTTIFATFYLGLDPSFHDNITGGEVNVVTTAGGGCTFSGTWDTTSDFHTLVLTSDLDSPVFIQDVELTGIGSGCNSIDNGDTFEFEFGGGNWNGAIGSRTDGADNVFYRLLTVPTGEGEFNPLGGFSYGFNSNLDTKFLTIDITNDGNDVLIDIDYFLEEDEINTNIPEFNPTSVSASFVERPLTDFALIGTNIDNSQTATQTVSITIPDGSINNTGTFDLLIQFDNLNRLFSGIRPFADVFIYTQFTLSNKIITATGTPEFYDVTAVATSTTVYRACGITDIDGCLVNAFSFLFVPTDITTNSFANLVNITEDKFPFAYFFEIQDIIATAEVGSDTIVSLVLASPTSSPIQYNVEYLSEAQMRVFFDDGSIILFRGIIEVAMWLSLMTMIFYSIRGVFHSQTA